MSVHLLKHTKTKLYTMGDWAFCLVAPRLWTARPEYLWMPKTVDALKFVSNADRCLICRAEGFVFKVYQVTGLSAVLSIGNKLILFKSRKKDHISSSNITKYKVIRKFFRFLIFSQFLWYSICYSQLQEKSVYGQLSHCYC